MFLWSAPGVVTLRRFNAFIFVFGVVRIRLHGEIYHRVGESRALAHVIQHRQRRLDALDEWHNTGASRRSSERVETIYQVRANLGQHQGAGAGAAAEAANRAAAAAAGGNEGDSTENAKNAANHLNL